MLLVQGQEEQGLNRILQPETSYIRDDIQRNLVSLVNHGPLDKSRRKITFQYGGGHRSHEMKQGGRTFIK